MIKIPYFNARVSDYVNAEIEWCDIWDQVDKKMIPDILERISESFPLEFGEWIKSKSKIELDVIGYTENRVNRSKQQDQARLYRKLHDYIMGIKI